MHTKNTCPFSHALEAPGNVARECTVSARTPAAQRKEGTAALRRKGFGTNFPYLSHNSRAPEARTAK
ncbi:hypothetical protein [Caballeronia glebae]|uniref:hypothetical protein n=1 Tax=Caballeronia glebae TaxID=1777143 RepID=UPI000A82F079|nr:hypothetical protein [Caballeronia glebae]